MVTFLFRLYHHYHHFILCSFGVVQWIVDSSTRSCYSYFGHSEIRKLCQSERRESSTKFQSPDEHLQARAAARARALATLRAASASRVAHMLEFAIQQAEEAGIDTAEARALLEELQSSSSTADVAFITSK